ncbi:MAG TPA: hypothetical protein PKB09_03460 [Candidatus Saccharibacteria bacterium]|nr:hypothetical protein [Candidatus Saccharibacteria bacterium]
MFLRKTLEQKLKVRDDEVKLPDSVSGSIFRGSYFGPSTITKIENTTNYSPRTKDAYPYQRKVTKTYSDGSKVFRGNHYDDPVYSERLNFDDLLVANSERGLRRATRVERIARRIKTVALGIGAVAMVGLLTIGALSDSSPEQIDEVPTCDTVAGNGESLLSISADQIDPAEQLGQTVCSVNDENYLVIMPTEPQ